MSLKPAVRFRSEIFCSYKLIVSDSIAANHRNGEPPRHARTEAEQLDERPGDQTRTETTAILGTTYHRVRYGTTLLCYGAI